MSENITEYIERLDIKGFEKIITKRRSIINAASADLPLSDYNANFVAKALHPKTQDLVVSRIEEHTENARIYFLEPAPGTKTKALAYFRAGQYLSVKLQINESFITRPYTISSPPAEALKGRYALTIKRLDNGFASNFIFNNWQVGTVIETSAPQGEFVYEPIRDAPHIVALAGGSGVTPFHSLVRAIADGTEDAMLTLLYGSRKRDNILLKKELDILAASCDKVKVVHVLSDDLCAAGFEHGFLTAELIKKYAPDDDYSIFISGPAAMYRFLETEIPKLGLPRRRVRREVFGEYKSPENDDEYPREAAGKTFKLQVDIRGEKMIIPARSGESILVAMERAGIKGPSICRSGECGFCRSRLVSGSYYIPKDLDYRRMADAKHNYLHPCCTFPTSNIHIRLASDEGEIKREPWSI